ncbi:hypothetical protein BDV27DRAFT_166010 [Aspergillus caelatus]|uniref:Uncharacterized protein n=1 Tax=Aspergillus caelatus TaxID=61420 RepID=A0A5N6ZZK5_9EURO|nr:uncharacterized protein BDV27DRAFT_166010 [Aspergillus caelatus]KAE8362693.1 hypothetical protein BDV27DRAFT_166010 [Aspergillus caelatus]
MVLYLSIYKPRPLYALNACYNTETPYIGIFEDDIIFADGWFAKALQGLFNIEDRSGLNTHGHGWIYLRLFYIETALSWSEDDFWYRHMNMLFFIMVTMSFGVLMIIRSLWGSSRRYLDVRAIVVICVVTVPAFTGLAFRIGKYSLFPMQSVVEMEKYGCCTQAMVFPRDQEYTDQKKLHRYALAPPQVQYAGIHSSRDNLEINTRSTWAFWFEENEAGALSQEHTRLLESNSMVWFNEA